jgi:hypothetical protein
VALANRARLRQIESMPVPVELLRAVLVLLAVFFGYMLGRSAVRVYRGAGKGKMYGWLVRTLVTTLAASWRRGMDLLMVVLLVLLVLAIAGGAWHELRPRKPAEDLTREIFPE